MQELGSYFESKSVFSRFAINYMYFTRFSENQRMLLNGPLFKSIVCR